MQETLIPPTGVAADVAAGRNGDRPSGRSGNVRWSICFLIFAATTINYIDRQVVGVLKPTLDTAFHWTQVDYSNIVLLFTTAYAIGQFFVGFFLDRVGLRRGFAIAVFAWSVAAIAHGLVGYLPMDSTFAHNSHVLAVGGLSVLAFSTVRLLLGLAESANFPAAIKTVAVWFPQKERSLATGFVNAGSNVGALTTPLIVPYLTLRYGWPMAFFVTGALGLGWLVLWLTNYQDPEKHPRLSLAEKVYIVGDPDPSAPNIPWNTLLLKRQTWAFACAKFFSDPVWALYLFWAPDFLHHRFGLNLKSFGPPLVIIYLMADVGSVAGGWLSGFLIERGWSVNAARKSTMLVCALFVFPVIGALYTDNVWLAVVLIGLAASAHQGWSSNIFTMVSDTTPRRAVGSVCGMGGTAGQIGVMLMTACIGRILDVTHSSYVIPLTAAPFSYIAGLLLVQLLVPHFEQMEAPVVDRRESSEEPRI